MSKRIQLSVVGTPAMPDELLIEILSRLPTKSLRRFQCVSKGWHSLISHVSSQRRILLPMAGLFCYESSDSSQGFYASIHPDPRSREEDCRVFQSRWSRLPSSSTLHLIHSCNGLLLFTECQISRCSYYVWNPATMEFVGLPERLDTTNVVDCFLAFDPRVSPHYKVARFIFNHKACIAVEIYSSTTGSWTEFNPRPPRPRRWTEFNPPPPRPPCLIDCDSMPAFHKGTLYMLTYSNHLARFDIDEGSFHQIMLPEAQPAVLSRYACIGESIGHLYYAMNLYKQSELQIYMLDDGSSKKWVLTHKMCTRFFDHHPLICELSRRHKPSLNFKPIAFHPESELIYLRIPYHIVSYRPSNGRLEEVCKMTDLGSTLHWGVSYCVIPCLE